MLAKLISITFSRSEPHNERSPRSTGASGEINQAITLEPMIVRYTRPMNEAAKAIHLICWRTSPLECRKRTTRLAAEASMHRGNKGSTIQPAATTQGCPSNPNGLRAPPSPSRGPGIRKVRTLTTTITAPDKRASGRHLLDGRRPSGNSRSKKVPSSPTAGTHSQAYSSA